MNKNKIRSTLFLLTVLIIGIIIYSIKFNNIATDYYVPPVLPVKNNFSSYRGSKPCLECHADIYRNHIKTAHHRTSALADSATIKGSFKEDSNVLDLKDVIYKMEEKDDSFYQHTKIKNRDIEIAPAKFDIVIGSGLRGQTYLSWKEDELFQLQPSYHTSSDAWINSPGYPTYYLERPIRDACLKCHVTFAENKGFSANGNKYFKERMVYGIDCEKCHRPSSEHVSYHLDNPEATKAKFMLKFDTLTRLQRLDACAQCHSGPRNIVLQGNSFSFQTGDKLDEYMINPDNHASNENLDVHGNQYGLLTQSECFKQTSNLDCTTCHDPHKNQRGATEYFNQKCMSCHSQRGKNCSKDDKMEAITSNNCIACHMPISPSKTMTAQLKKDSTETAFYIRTHLIGIYSDGSIQEK